MDFRLLAPAADLADLVDSYWIVESECTEAIEQKIIPDGYPEIIFHFGDPYEIRLGDDWRRQASGLLAGQITRWFALRNTGRTAMVGIKLMPHAPNRLFGLDMNRFVDRVVDIGEALPGRLDAFARELRDGDDAHRVAILDSFLRGLRPPPDPGDPVARALGLILASRGTQAIADLCAQVGVSERTLERRFRKAVGLTPKLHSRIVRFARLFRAIDDERPDLGELGLDAGFYDQPHFIRNFKAFTGVNPSRYRFANRDLANFFLRR